MTPVRCRRLDIERRDSPRGNRPSDAQRLLRRRQVQDARRLAVLLGIAIHREFRARRLGSHLHGHARRPRHLLDIQRRRGAHAADLQIAFIARGQQFHVEYRIGNGAPACRARIGVRPGRRRLTGCATWIGAGSGRLRSLVHLPRSTGEDCRRRAPASQSGTPKCAPLKISSMGGGCGMPACSSAPGLFGDSGQFLQQRVSLLGRKPTSRECGSL